MDRDVNLIRFFPFVMEKSRIYICYAFKKHYVERLKNPYQVSIVFADRPVSAHIRYLVKK